MIEAYLKVKDYNELKCIPNLKDIIILCQIWNTIRSGQRLLMDTEKRTDSPIKKRDIFYGLITTSSYVYEGMKRANSIMLHISKDIPNKLHSDIAWLQSEIKNNKSFFNTSLAQIRNNIGFHFNLSITDNQIENAVKNFPPIFAKSTSTRKFDFVYILAEHIMAKFPPFTGLSNMNSKPELEKLIINLREYSIRFCDFIEKVITILMANYVYLKQI